MTDQPNDRDAAKPADPYRTATTDELATDRPSDSAEFDTAQGGTANRPAGPDYGASPLEDESPGSQGEIESGSEGDFGGPDPEKDRPTPA